MRRRTIPPRKKPRKGRVGVQRTARADEVAVSQIVRAARAALNAAPVRSINVVLVDDQTMTSLHERFMGHTGPTDVLTFDLRDDAARPEIEGEIAISVDAARRQARRWRASTAEELLRYVIHGVLHLLGYDDDTPAGRRRMRRQENKVLASLRLPSLRRKSGLHV